MARKFEERVIRKLRKELKTIPSVLEHLKDRDEDLDFIDSIPISFAPLDVSAKTVNGEVILNEKLLDADFRDILRYCVHETIHCLQQAHGEADGRPQGADYLDDPNEVEAFKAQLDYQQEAYGEEEIQAYIDRLLDHHEVRGKERARKIKELLN